MKAIVGKYRAGVTVLVGEHYGDIATRGLEGLLIGIAIVIVFLGRDMVLLLATPLSDSVVGTLDNRL